MPSQPGDGRGSCGRAGETLACNLLERRGYRIVDINVRPGTGIGVRGEIDIIAWDGPTLCFIEVKTRRARANEDVFPAEAVTLAKQRQIARLAQVYTVRCHLYDEVPLRFDVVAITLADRDSDTRLELIRGAFFAPEGF